VPRPGHSHHAGLVVYPLENAPRTDAEAPRLRSAISEQEAGRGSS